MPRGLLGASIALVIVAAAGASIVGMGPPRPAPRPQHPASATPIVDPTPVERASVSPSPVPRPAPTTPARPAAPARTSPAQAAAIVAAPAGAWTSTSGSWYGYARPVACWGAHVPSFRQGPPAGDVWVANKTLPCGTQVEISGPAGSIVVEIRDRGPYVAGRDLDLSPSAFLAVVGSLGHGVAAMRYRVTAAP